MRRGVVARTNNSSYGGAEIYVEAPRRRDLGSRTLCGQLGGGETLVEEEEEEEALGV